MQRILATTLCSAAVLAAPAASAQDTSPSEWEGAIGLLASNSASFAGSDERKTSVLPGIYLRRGRWSITNASGFVTKKNEEVVRGLGVDLGHSPAWKVTLGLRFDAGRRESTSGELAGLGSVRATVRGRVAGRWSFDEHWQLNGGWSADVLGRGGGHFADFSIERHESWSPQTTWATGTGFTVAGRRYLQTWFGVTPEQSTRSGYAVYEPHAGLRDAFVYANARSEFAPGWVWLGGLSATRLEGPAADSPLVRRRSTWAINGGIARSF